jgi:transcriptional regulator of aromatic amino acid metabolism
MRVTDFSCPSELNLMMALLAKGHRPALLVNCNGRGADAVAMSMLSWCAAPVHLVRLPGILDLPLAGCGTLVVSDAAALTQPQQIELHEWLNAGHGSVQIVSIASEPLWSLVEQGRFLEGLFYRLNVVTLEAGGTLM